MLELTLPIAVECVALHLMELPVRSSALKRSSRSTTCKTKLLRSFRKVSFRSDTFRFGGLLLTFRRLLGMATDSTRLFEDRSAIELAGSDMTRMAAKEAFSKAKIGPEDVQVIELHDCCTFHFVTTRLSATG